MNKTIRQNVDALDFNAEDDKVQTTEGALILMLIFVVGLMSAQRFWLPQISALICASLILVPIIYGVQHKYSFAISLIALIAMNDLGGSTYNETPSFIKYIFYLNGIYFGFFLQQYHKNPRWIHFIGFNSLVLLNTVLHKNQLDPYTFIRDLMTLCIFWVVVLAKPVEAFRRVRFNLILAFALGVITSEFVNSLFSFRPELGDYLSYSSSKYIVAFPLLYCLVNQYVTRSIILFPITFWVELNYNSKTLVLSSGIIFASILLRNLLKKSVKSVLIILLVCGFVFAAGELTFNTLGANRVFATVSQIFSSGLNTIDLEDVDAVRAAEKSYFFNQDFYHIIFGNGLGSGMLDLSGLFGFALDDSSAFSLDERNRSHFFRLHDSWTWFGFRFGLLPYSVVVLWCLKCCFNRCSEVVLVSSTMFLALINSTFSINGLIAFGILALSTKISLGRKSQTHQKNYC